MNAFQIIQCLVEIFEEESLSYLFITYHLKKKKLGTQN